MSDDTNAIPVGNDGDNGQLEGLNLPNFAEIDPETATPEQVEQLKKAGQTLLGQARHYKEKAQKLSQTVQRAPDPPQPIGGGDDDLRKDVEELKLEREKRRFQSTHGLDPDETDNLFALAKGMGIPPEKAIDHPFFKSGLDAWREQRRSSGAIPGPSSRSPVVEGKPVKDLGSKDIADNYAKVTAAVAQARRK